MHERYLHPLIENKHELDLVMAAIERTVRNHEDEPVQPLRKKPVYDTTKPPASVTGGRFSAGVTK